jgi:hypothetical protein
VVFDRLSEEMCAALTAADDVEAGAAERAEMLMEIAMGLQRRPKSPDHLQSAVALYDKALTISPEKRPAAACADHRS